MKGAEENMISHGSVNFDLTEFCPRVVFFLFRSVAANSVYTSVSISIE